MDPARLPSAPSSLLGDGGELFGLGPRPPEQALPRLQAGRKHFSLTSSGPLVSDCLLFGVACWLFGGHPAVPAHCVSLTPKFPLSRLTEDTCPCPHGPRGPHMPLP